ncbi:MULTISPECIES: ribonuclease E/G [Exiguobacterium]|uniref:Ribonuclease E/G n=1 Tax=Exiguobacterium antarcticum TaxID=132920 RepID=A0ABT6R0Y7_9BACL|nr:MULTISPECIES: ribonuclease E/G [Exiguobacterium]MCT4778746.1 ribonuclease E/G [Exiguobacterium soli]MDI3234505.1 ribonuclease E/G [Exiguobacterium antarcticum]
MKWISEQTPSLERVALVEGGRVIEYHERMRDEIRVGTLLHAKVDRLHPTLEAAFLIATDGTPLYLPINETLETLRRYPDVPTIGQAVQVGQTLLVQVVKEGATPKQHKVTQNITYGGRFLVYFPYGRRVRFSRKLDLVVQQQLAKRITLEAAEGLLYRTEAAQAEATVLIAELNQLRARHQHMLRQTTLEQDESLVIQEAKRLSHVEEALVTHRLDKERLEQMGLRVERPVVKGRLPAMEQVDRTIEKALDKVVWLDGGAYLLIEEVETMTVIDVNSGKMISVKEQKRTFDQINEAAAVEIMRQLRLRNISGMIAVDFLRGSSKGQTRVTQLLKERAAHESKQVEIYGFTKMGLCELTRQRHGKSLLERSLDQGQPSRIAIHRQLEPRLKEIATYAEAAVVRAPLASLSPLLLEESPLELILVEGETGILFTGTKVDCDDFVKRQQ